MELLLDHRCDESRYLLRTTPASGVTGGVSCGDDSLSPTIRWPWLVGSWIEATDWEPSQCCGGGIHGYLQGEGRGSQLLMDEDAIWQVLEILPGTPVTLIDLQDGKAKARGGILRYSGARAGAVEFCRSHCPHHLVWGASYTAGYSGTATAGYSGTATAGYSGTATAGYSGIVQIRYWDGRRDRLATGYVGEGGIKPGVAYRCDDGGKLVEVQS